MYIESVRQLPPLRQVVEMGALGSGGRKFGSRTSGHYADIGMEDEEFFTAQSQQRRMASQMLLIQENERKRIASDLHDGLGQTLTMLKLALAESERLLDSGAIEEASASLQRLRRNAHQALEDVRHVAMDLRPPMLDDLGILPTLSWYFRELENVCRELRVEKDFSLHENCIPGALKITIFRIIQEATSNITKYAHADLIRVTLKKAGGVLHFSIEDNGDGFDPAEVAIRSGSDRGLGLLSMKERAHLSGGEYTMDSVAGRGTRICISWQLDRLSNVM